MDNIRILSGMNRRCYETHMLTNIVTAGTKIQVLIQK